VKVADLGRNLRIFFGDTLFEAAFAYEHEPAVKPLRFYWLHVRF
jgi:hypothetical protein